MKRGVAPLGWQSVTPRIVAHDARGLVAFLADVFGALGEYDPAAPSVITIGNSKIMISEAGERDPKGAFLYVYVTDPDSAYLPALELGANSIEAPFDTHYGDRRCMVEDRWGNAWQIAARKINVP